MADGWEERAALAMSRYEDGASRLPDHPDERQRQLTRMGNTAWAAGLSFLMLGNGEAAGTWLLTAAERYRESWEDAPPESWGRPIGAMKARLIAGDLDGVRPDADWALIAGAAGSDSPIGLYAGALAHLIRGEDDEAAALTAILRDRDDFPRTVADTLAAISAGDAQAYHDAIRALLSDFEGRTEFLEDIPVADTILAFHVLAETRGLAISLASPLLPS